ncbi:MAG: leucine-rich repeat domain-containing protein [Oscillospiraceae bacterium]|nr:leucine-rich repeat domain-containing protein [Oscillospiraceae bacterium]
MRSVRLRACLAGIFACLLLLLLPSPVSAETPSEEIRSFGGYDYILLEDGTAKILRHSGGEKELGIPSVLDGYTVTALGDGAFQNAGSIESITIPDSVVDLGINPFSSCSRLKEIFVSPAHPTLVVEEGVLFSKPDSRLVCFPVELFTNYYTVPGWVREIGSRAFFNSEHLVSITIPESVKLIGESAFSVCSYLEKVNILGGVTKIGDYAFHLCERLLSVKLADSVTEIGRYAFLGCRKLNDLTIPQSVTDIGEGAFLQVPR